MLESETMREPKKLIYNFQVANFPGINFNQIYNIQITKMMHYTRPRLGIYDASWSNSSHLGKICNLVFFCELRIKISWLGQLWYPVSSLPNLQINHTPSQVYKYVYKLQFFANDKIPGGKHD